MNLKNLDIRLIIIIIISIIATLNAFYLTDLAYALNEPTFFGEARVGGSICDINNTLSCSNVFLNDFAWFFGIPFSLLALFVYPIVIIIALLGMFNKLKDYYKYLFIISILGLFFNGYIIVNEYLAGVYCPLCLLCTGIIIINGIISLIGIKTKKIN